jgi:hypothetical protein
VLTTAPKNTTTVPITSGLFSNKTTTTRGVVTSTSIVVPTGTESGGASGTEAPITSSSRAAAAMGYVGSLGGAVLAVGAAVLVL